MSINKYINQLSVSIRRCEKGKEEGGGQDTQGNTRQQRLVTPALAPGNYFAEKPCKRPREDDKNGNMAFKVHKMAVIHALLLRGHNE